MADVAMSRVRRAYERLLSGGEPPAESVRQVVRDSWLRSVRGGVNPGADPGLTDQPLSDADFEEYRRNHRLTAVRPLVQSLMLDDIAGSDVVVALTDREGRLLWVEGDNASRDRAAAISFVEGSVWSEDTVGTNAPGLALTVGEGVQVLGPEHFFSEAQDFNCAAAPVHDPITGELLGAIDVTGGAAAGGPFALAAVRSVVAAVERELASQAVDLAPLSNPHRIRRLPHLTVLAAPSWSGGGARRHALSPRHAEILLLLMTRPEGLSTGQLAELLSEDDLGAVTVRAEISRLRRDLGDLIAARPYRLTVTATSDVAELRQLIERGALTDAVATLGRGGLLAESTAPGVIGLFEEIREDLRSRLLASADAAALAAWTASAHGRDDLFAWQRLTAVLPPGDAQRTMAAGRARLLDKRYRLG